MPETIDTMQYREAKIGQAGGPSTINLDDRSVEAVGASESPVMERDWKTWEIYPTVLLMRGCVLPENGQLPLLDNHSRWGSSSVIGSYRDVKIDGDKLVGRAVFSTSPEVEPVWTRVREGHITDLSVGRVDIGDPVIVPEGQTAVVEGRTFTGPVRVVTRWQPKEMSVTPIGADAKAKMRSEFAPQTSKDQQREEIVMAEEKKRVAEAIEAPPAAQAEAQPAEPVVETRTAADGFGQAVEVMELCDRHGIDGEKRKALLKPEMTMDQVRQAVLDELAGRSAASHPGFAPDVPVERGADERDKFRSAAADGLILRAGFDIEKPAAGADELRGYTLIELARRSLEKAGQPAGGNVLEMVSRAMTTSDLPQLMSNVANKSLFEGYEAADESWRAWCATGSVNDFKTNTLAMVSEFDDLDQIVNDTGYKYGERSDAAETFQIATYGKLFGITRTTIINDDLGGMVDTLMTMGEAAARKVGDLPYAVLTANAAMRDGKALFHTDHGNLGTGAALGEASIAEAIKLAKLQKNLKAKQRLNIKLNYFLAPAALEGSSEVFFGSNQFSSDNKGSTRTNPYAGSKFERVYEARLDDSSATAWYMAGPKGKTIKVFFLGGNQTPYMETKTGWGTDGVEYKVRIDGAAKAIDWKALVKNAGA